MLSRQATLNAISGQVPLGLPNYASIDFLWLILTIILTQTHTAVVINESYNSTIFKPQLTLKLVTTQLFNPTIISSFTVLCEYAFYSGLHDIRNYLK